MKSLTVAAALLLTCFPVSAATVWLYTCTGTRGEATALGGAEYGTCSPASTGSWQQITYQEQLPAEWWNLQIPGEQLPDLLSAILLFFAVVGVGKTVDRAFQR